MAVAGAASGVQASDEAVDLAAEARWIPGLAITSRGSFQDRAGTVETLERGFVESTSLAAGWSIGLDFELASPVIANLPGRPRLFAHGGPRLAFDTEDPVANEGDPGKPVVVELPPVGQRPLAGVTGRGSATRVETRPLAWSAGAGIAFETALYDLTIRLKPSFEWHFQRDRLRASFTDAEVAGFSATECTPCRLIQIDSTSIQDYHSLGPGLEVEFDVARLTEQFSITAFTTFHALALVSGRNATQTTTRGWTINGAPDTMRADSTVTSRYRREVWHYQAGVGVRIRWFPES